MDEERNFTVQLVTASQVADVELFTAVSEQNPLLAKLMLDQFKLFLTNEYFTSIERQSILMKFLSEGQQVKLVQQIREYINNSEFKQDYDTIFMEWTFHHSKDLIEIELQKYDGVGLNLTKQEQYTRLHKPSKILEDIPEDVIKTLTSILIDNATNPEDNIDE